MFMAYYLQSMPHCTIGSLTGIVAMHEQEKHSWNASTQLIWWKSTQSEKVHQQFGPGSIKNTAKSSTLSNTCEQTMNIICEQSTWNIHGRSYQSVHKITSKGWIPWATQCTGQYRWNSKSCFSFNPFWLEGMATIWISKRSQHRYHDHKQPSSPKSKRMMPL